MILIAHSKEKLLYKICSVSPQHARHIKRAPLDLLCHFAATSQSVLAAFSLTFQRGPQALTTFYYLSFPLTLPPHTHPLPPLLLGYICYKSLSLFSYPTTQPTQTPRRTRTKATLRTPRRHSNVSARSMTRARSKAIRTYRTPTRTWPCRCCVPRIYHCCRASKQTDCSFPLSPPQLSSTKTSCTLQRNIIKPTELLSHAGQEDR